jgi:D-glycero-D-manno-heptose 1,7-bisphosphate phosphatase
MFHDIAERLHIDLAGVPAIGDSLRDLQAAQTAGASPILVKTGKGFGTVSHPAFDRSLPVFDDLYSAVSHLLDN